MNVLDIIIIVMIIAQAVFWAQKGFTRGFFSLIGFWLGLFAGAWLAPHVLDMVGGGLAGQIIFAFAAIFLLAFAGEAIGRAIGIQLATVTQRLKLEKLDSVLGAAFGMWMTVIIIWLLAAVVSGLPARELNRQISESASILAINSALPSAPDAISRLAGLINVDGFPQVFIGPEPQPIEPVDPPTSGEIAQALRAAGRSTVRIEGVGCGGIMNGSGFVAAPGLVVTNAHVVAGIGADNLVAEDAGGRHGASVVVFNPDLDIAILRADGLAGSPLAIAQDVVSRGTAGVALGYPGGGPLEVGAAGVLRQLEARGRNIYGERAVTRSVYELQTSIEEGNSGGPVVLPDGTVIGVIFARSLGFENTGYAVTSPEVTPLIESAQNRSQPASTGVCVR